MLNQSYSKYAKKDISILFIYFAAFFMVCNIPLIRNLQNSAIIKYHSAVDFYTAKSLFLGAPIYVFVTLLSIVEAFRQYGFLHNRSQSDFYYSLPVNRHNLMLSSYFTGITFVMLPFVLNILLGLTISSVNGLSSKTMLRILFAVLFEIIFFTMCYTICVFFMITTGKTAVYFCCVAGVNLFFICIVYIFGIIFKIPLEKLSDTKYLKLTDTLYEWALKLSPAMHFANISSNAFTYDSDINLLHSTYFEEPTIGNNMMKLNLTDMTDCLPILLIAIAVFFILDFVLFSKIKVENGDKFMVFSKSERPVQMIFTIISGIIISVMFSEFYWRNSTLKITNYILAAFISVFLVHSLFEIAYSGSLKKILTHKWQLIICIVITFACSVPAVL